MERNGSKKIVEALQRAFPDAKVGFGDTRGLGLPRGSRNAQIEFESGVIWTIVIHGPNYKPNHPNYENWLKNLK